MPPLSVLMKPSSSMCNMSCSYCFYCDEAEKRSQPSFGFMSEQTLKNIIRKTMLRASGYISYAYQGGEPTLRGLDFFKSAVAYQRQYNRNHIEVHNALQTNGYALDEEWCRFLKEHNFLVGLSLDGTRDIHDSLRHDKAGGPTFDRIAAAARRMDQYNVDYNILTVVTPEIAANIKEIYGFYRQQGWRFQQYIACLDPLGEGHGKTPHALMPETYGHFLAELFRLWYRDWKKGQQPFIRQFENYVGLAAGYMAESCDQRGTCGIQYVVEADGSVYPCDFYMLDEYRLGNFNQDNLDIIDAGRQRIGFLKRSQKLTEECRLCPYYPLCRGGCQRNRDLDPATGLYTNYFCEGYRLFFAECYDKIIEVAGSLPF
ncbi:MAG: anaerobic sulfatase maturase [Lachnospiraceae bacterium]|nr:anaerobic sulfatase maturase [Lachnospiraceae bacterium]